MTAIETKYTPGKYGLGNEFAQSSVPIEYSYRLTNRFINLQGNAEKIQGLDPFGQSTVSTGTVVPGQPTITGIHEHINDNGTVTLMVSANGTIWSINETTGNYTQILTGKDPTKRLQSIQMGRKLIFWNGSDRNFYTDDGVTFKPLVALMAAGTMSSATSAVAFTDANTTNWLTQTFVTDNDLVWNSTKNAYAIVTSVGASNISHTAIGSAATGLGSVGQAVSANQNSGDNYQIIDLVSLNIFPQNNNSYVSNTTGTTGTNTTSVVVSGVDWTQTEIAQGDYIYNTTRAAIAAVSAVTTATLTTTYVSGQTANDSFEFFKSAMPITDYAHVHYGRAMYVDTRHPSQVIVSGPSDPQDLTTYQRTLSSTSLDYGSDQPNSETILSLETFQSFLVACGKNNIYADNGINAVADTSATTVDLTPVGLFPQGAVSPFGNKGIGGSFVFLANDGLRNFSAVFGNLTFQTSNVSEAIKSDLRSQIVSQAGTPTNIQAIHYPRRNWVLCKVGDTIYNYNYTPSYSNGQITQSSYGSWSTFTSKLAQQEVYYVRRNGDLLCAGSSGKLYKFEAGHYEDDGSPIETVLETGFLTLNEPQQSTQYRTGNYIRPQFEAGAPVEYTITVTGDYNQISTDTVSISTGGVGEVGFAQIGLSPIGGQRILDKKLPLRWKGKQFKIRIETNDASGPDIIAGFTVYGNVLGKI